MDTTILEDLGLTNAEIKVYIALLELGSSSAGKIIEKSNLQNSVIHRSLHTLINKGLISYILEGKKRIYQASDPERFHNYIEEKKSRFDELLPELRKKQHFAEQPTKATIYKGIKGIKEIYTVLLNSGGKEYNTFGGGKRVTYKIMTDTWWKNLHTKRIAKKIPSRQIFDNSIRSFGEQLNKKKITKIKFLSQEFEQLQETVIIGDYVAINLFTENPYGLLIKDPTVVQGYKKYFELLWNKAKD
jgi:sugar-specific transcriptional regulator TrmB